MRQLIQCTAVSYDLRSWFLAHEVSGVSMADVPGHADVDGSINKEVLDHHEEHGNIALSQIVRALLLVIL